MSNETPRFANPIDGKREIVLPCSFIRKVARVVTKTLGTSGTKAITIGDDTYVIDGEVPMDARLRAHEDKHVEQVNHYRHLYGQLFGSVVFWTKYIAQHMKHGYLGNRYEVEARKAEDVAAVTTDPQV